MRIVTASLLLPLALAACAAEDPNAAATLGTLPDPSTGKADGIGARRIVWTRATDHDIVLTPSVGQALSALGNSTTLSYGYDGEARIDRLSDTEVFVTSDRIVLPIRDEFRGDHWITPRGIIDYWTDRVGFIMQFRLVGETEWRNVTLTPLVEGPDTPDHVVSRRATLDFWGVLRNGHEVPTSITDEDIASTAERVYSSWVRPPQLSAITGFDFAIIPVPYRTLGSVEGSYGYTYSGYGYCSETRCGGFRSGETPALSYVGTQATCVEHTDCPAEERCECHSSRGWRCTCLLGERGTTPFGGACEWGVDCGSGQCGHISSRVELCTRSCTTDADCGGDLPFCDPVPISESGRPACGRVDAQVLVR